MGEESLIGSNVERYRLLSTQRRWASETLRLRLAMSMELYLHSYDSAMPRPIDSSEKRRVILALAEAKRPCLKIFFHGLATQPSAFKLLRDCPGGERSAKWIEY